MARKSSAPPASQDLSIEEALSRAYAHWNAGQADQAELFCQRVLAVWPGQADALHLLGIIAHAYGNLDLALQHLRHACQAPRAPAIYFSNLAEMCRQKGLLSEGEQAGRRAVALDGNLVAGWNNLGIILQEAGKLEESLDCLERVVSLQPNYPEAHNNLGNTCKRLGRLDRAEMHYAKALSFNPNYAEAHSNLANLLNERGHFDQAAEEARRAIDINPQLADAYINLAAVETSRYRHAESLRWLDALLTFAPLHPGGLSARALALKQLDRLDEALESAKRAAATASESAEAHNTLGQILQAMGQFEEALNSFERAASLPGVVTESALVNRAVLYMETGRKDEAKAAFERALASFPRSAGARYNQSDIKTFAADDPDIARMETMLLGDEVQSHADRMSLHFTLGKAYLDIKDSEKAFRHLNEGNRMKRSSFTFDSEATSQWMKKIAETFSPALLKTFKDAGDPSTLPVFIVGIPRSGTTLVEQILASHPQIHGAGELSHLQRLVDAIGNYPDNVNNFAKNDFAQLGRRYVQRTLPLSQGKRHVVDKMPANFLHAGLIRLILPEARIIHCRRDPVDTCLSCYSKLFTAEQMFTYDMNELGRFHRDYQGLMAHWRQMLPADRFIEVDYESVVDNLEEEARRLVGFLGLDWDETCIRFYENRRTVRTASVNQVRQPIYKTSKGRWKAHAAQLAPLLAALGVDQP
jgi:tetratricopeptide (TPR) repeat protein